MVRARPWPAQALFWIALAVFALVLSLYAAKWVRHPAAARAELRHPVRMAFAPRSPSACWSWRPPARTSCPAAATVAWWIGAVGHLVRHVVVMGAWFEPRRHGLLDQVTPAWFIPVVGNVITPLAAPAVGNVELAWFSFGRSGWSSMLALLPILLLPGAAARRLRSRSS